MALGSLPFDGMAPIKAFEMGHESGLQRLAQQNKLKIGQVMSQGDYKAGAKAAYGFGDLETGSALSRLAAQEQQQINEQQMAQQKAQRESMLGEQMAGVVGQELGGLARLSPSMAAQIYSAQQQNNFKMQQAAQPDLPPGWQMNGQTGKAEVVPGYDPTITKPIQPRALTSVDKTAILEADNVVQTSKNTIDLLNKALLLNDKAGSGYTANMQSFLARNDPTGYMDQSKGEATTEFSNIVMGDALAGMKAIFGANPTEGERSALEKLQASIDKTPAERKGILRRAISLAKIRMDFNAQRAKELRSGEYFGGASTVEPDANGYQGADGITSQDIGGLGNQQIQYDNADIEMLTANPTPQVRAQFDEAFGPGAADQVLGPSQ